MADPTQVSLELVKDECVVPPTKLAPSQVDAYDIIGGVDAQ